MQPARLCALLLATPLAMVVAPSAGAFVPTHLLDPVQWNLLHAATTRIAHAALVNTVHSRHGGHHRAADKPSGNLLVKPVDERRVHVVDGFREHIDAALTLPFMRDSRLRASALPPDMAAAVIFAVEHRDDLVSIRRAAVSEFVAACSSVRAISVRINAQLMPPSVFRTAAKVNTACLIAVVDAFKWLDTALPERFVFGFPVVGHIPDSGVFRYVGPPVRPDAFAARYAWFLSSAPQWARSLNRRLLSIPPSPLSIRGYEKTRSELSKRVIVGPYRSVSALRDALAADFPGMPPGTFPRPLSRFTIEQKDSVRNVDDGKSNGANDATALVETITTPFFSMVAVVARAAVVVCGSRGIPVLPMTVSLADLTMAYRTIPTSQPWFTSFATLNPITDPPSVEYYYLPGHPFGLASAVVNFNRFPELISVVLRLAAACPFDHFYDDFIGVDIGNGADSCERALSSVINAVGAGGRRPHAPVQAPELDPGKTQHTAPSNVVLGVHADLSYLTIDGTVRFRATPKRVKKILDTFGSAYARGRLTPSEAASLRGKLQFVLSTAYACLGRAATLPLLTRQYRDVSHDFAAGSDLHHSLKFFQALLPNLPPLIIPVTPDTTPPLLVYSDASFSLRRVRQRVTGACDPDRLARLSGGLGVVVFDPIDRTVLWASARPDWPTLMRFWPEDRKTYIAQLELLAAVSAYSTYPSTFSGRRVHHFIDNTVALSALVHGYSKKADLAHMVNAFYLQLTGLRASVYFDYVPSKANVADLPSRNGFVELNQILSSPPAFLPVASDTHVLIVPPLAKWDGPLADWVTDSAFPGQAWPV